MCSCAVCALEILFRLVEIDSFDKVPVLKRTTQFRELTINSEMLVRIQYLLIF